MSNQAKWGLVLLLVASVARADEPKEQPEEKRVRHATRLDWEFVAGKPAKLPPAYDPRKVRYRLYVPPSYKPTKTWPLIVFIAPGDAPLGWKAFEKACVKHEALFCVAHGAGNDREIALRARIACDVLDEVRRDYRIDPDRTYAAGQGGSAAVAVRLGTALPELFGGVLLLSGDAPLPRLDHLRFRLEDRLSVALVCGENDPLCHHLKQYRLRQLAGLGVRAKFWETESGEGELPPADSLIDAFAWLDEDLKRRRADSLEHGRPDLAANALKRAGRDSRVAARLLRASAELEWIAQRFGESETGRQAQKRFQAMREEPQTSRPLKEAMREETKRILMAEAKALTKGEQWIEARKRWKELAESLTDADARDEARDEVIRLDGILARKPYLGMAFEGATATLKSVTPDGPAHRAGLRAGDRIEKRETQPIESSADLRKALVSAKPGQVWALEVRRGRAVVKARLTLGSQPPD